MVSRITAALAARYKAIQEKEKGFTLIELLVVVIIIGVLAAIAIPVYMGVQNSAKDSAVKSDLTNAKIAMIAYQTDKGTWPTATEAKDAGTADLVKFGWTKGADTSSITLTTAPSATSAAFCFDAVSSTGAKFFVKDSAGVASGTCVAPAGS